MAVKKKRKTTKSQRGRQRRTQPPGFFSRLRSTVLRLLWRLLLWSGLFSLLLLLGYGYYLDRTISKTFEGRLWSVPAQVYAQPLELFAGLELTKRHLAVELDRLGYRQQRDLTSPGTYSVTDNALQVHLRGFRYIEGFRPAQRLRLTFDNKGIRQIQDSSGEALILTRLDPAKIGSFFPSHGEDRVILPPTEIPPLLAEGLKAIEDRVFVRQRRKM